MALVVLFLLLLSCKDVFSVTFEATTIPEGMDNEFPVIAAVANTENVQLFCFINRTNDGVQRRTQWSLLRSGSTDVFFTFNTTGFPNNPAFDNFVVGGEETFHTNLTILSFNSSFDNTTIGCGAGGEIFGRFDLFIIRPPVLLQESTPVSAVESSSFSFNIEDTPGYPPAVPQFTWYYNGAAIDTDSSNPNVSVYPVISFPSLNRSQSGNYSMIASNEGGSSEGYFILDVTYGPEATPLTGPVYALTSDSVNITSFSNIQANPFPNSTWTKDGSPLGGGGGGRINTDTIAGQLMITSVQLTDAGYYNNTLENSISSISNARELIVAEIPSQPRNVSISGDPEPTAVNVTWINPANAGTPPFSVFRVTIMSTAINRVITYAATNATDTELINEVSITGLIPNTEYTLTVRAVSSHSFFQSLDGTVSEPVQFNTTSTVPQFQSVILTNVNGNLSIQWTFLHTGGIELNSITVICQTDEELMSSGSGDEVGLMDRLMCSSMLDCAQRTSSIGPVPAGSTYTCTVTATNSIGSDIRTTNSTSTVTGIPSVPSIASVVSEPGYVTLQIQADNTGVNDMTDFQFIINALDESGVFRMMFTRAPLVSEFNGFSVNSTIRLSLSPGVYRFTAHSNNLFGTSQATPISMSVTVLPGPTSTTPTVSVTTSVIDSSSSVSVTETSTISTPTSEPTSGGLSGGAIAGIIISLIIVIALLVLVGLVIFYFYYKNKGGSYQVERAGKGVKVEELDIDIGTELKPTQQSGGGAGETEEGSKPELHYADLEHFAKKPRDGPKTEVSSKPLPIEEVQYSEIKPQKAKEESEAAKTPTNII